MDDFSYHILSNTGKNIGYDSEIAIHLSFSLQSIRIIVHIKDSIILSLNTVIAIRVAKFQSIYELEYLLTRLYTKRELLGSLIHHFTYLKGISLPHNQL